MVGFAREQHERILCCREVQRSIRDSVKRLLDDTIRRYGLEDEFKSTKTELWHKKKDSLFLFSGLAYDPDGVKSTEGITKCWVEEAHTISQASLDILIPTIRAEDSELWFSYNPRFDDDPIHTMFPDDVNLHPPRSLVVDVQYWDNPWFPSVLREEMAHCKRVDFDKYLHVWEGKTVQQSDEQVMHGCWKIEPVPEPPEGTILKYGVDWGFGSDPLAGVRSWIKDKTLFIDYEAGGQGVKLVDIPAELEKIPGIKRWPSTADSARPDTIDYMIDQGFQMDGAKKGKGSIEDGIEYIKGFNVIIDPRCKNVIDEFIHYKFKKDPHTGKVLPIIVDANNHWIDALRYSHEGAYRKITKGMDLS